MMDLEEKAKQIEALCDMEKRVIDLCLKLDDEGFEYRAIVYVLITQALGAMVVEGESDEEIKALYEMALRHAKDCAYEQMALEETLH